MVLELGRAWRFVKIRIDSSYARSLGTGAAQRGPDPDPTHPAGCLDEVWRIWGRGELEAVATLMYYFGRRSSIGDDLSRSIMVIDCE